MGPSARIANLGPSREGTPGCRPEGSPSSTPERTCGILTSGSSYSPRPSHPQRTVAHIGGFRHQSQWRGRAGFSPASQFPIPPRNIPAETREDVDWNVQPPVCQGARRCAELADSRFPAYAERESTGIWHRLVPSVSAPRRIAFIRSLCSSSVGPFCHPWDCLVRSIHLFIAACRTCPFCTVGFRRSSRKPNECVLGGDPVTPVVRRENTVPALK
jgi:hypothetical protein